jgi:uncharacterized protein (DUF608 family)
MGHFIVKKTENVIAVHPF